VFVNPQEFPGPPLGEAETFDGFGILFRGHGSDVNCFSNLTAAISHRSAFPSFAQNAASSPPASLFRK
jgi:hypothetical protein